MSYLFGLRALLAVLACTVLGMVMPVFLPAYQWQYLLLPACFYIAALAVSALLCSVLLMAGALPPKRDL